MHSQTGLRLLRGFFAQGYNQSITILIQLLSVPILLHAWGVDRYGAWLILSVVPTYLSLADMGFAQAATNDMTMCVARGDAAEANSVFHSVLVLVAGLSILVSLIAVAGILVFPMQTVLNVRIVSSGEVDGVLFFSVVYVFFSLMFGVLSGAVRAEGRFATMIVVSSTARLMECVGTLAAAVGGYGLVGAAFAILIVRVAANAVMAWLVRFRCKVLIFGVKGASWRQIKRLWTPSISFMAFPVGNAICIQGALMVVSYLSMTAVAMFSTARTLSRFGTNSLGLMNHTFLYDYGQCIGEQKKRFSSLFFTHAAFSFAGMTAYVLFMLLAGKWLYTIWTGKHILLDDMLFVVLLVQACAESLWAFLQTPLIAINRHPAIARNYLIGSIVALPMGYMLLQRTGSLAAFAAAFCLLFLVLSVLVFISLQNILPLGWKFVHKLERQ
jgi:O-antigen/teichoic acid export membrane protein